MRVAFVLLAMTFTASLAQADTESTFEPTKLEPLTNTEVIEHIRSELPKEKSVTQRTHYLSMFESLDKNRDEEVSLTEMRRHPTLANSFHKLDINNDGVLNRKEIQPLQEEVKGLRNILTLTALRII
ncbi:hypothetical protein [Amphritea japonica]|uniref:EF-hand domain-containing protein n=1 Tax=Amphritea japonica ATCC BAA-1530 TaxID=1278309 RepID=A0A7R6STI5_9GAMM|nr:hypothetical protein [Amphritea japonica]BBB26642.1 conserved hypothetical protein [Amphritea japonica ATCC BAA-1530]